MSIHDFHWLIVVLFVTLFAAAPAFAQRNVEKYRVYIGTETGPGDKEAKGIYTAILDRTTGQLSEPELAIECGGPGFLSLHPFRPWLYAIRNARTPDKPGGEVYAFSRDDATGKLTLLNIGDVPGAGVTHLGVGVPVQAVESNGRPGVTVVGPGVVVVASYGAGTIASLPILEDGMLGEYASHIVPEGTPGPHPQRQNKSYPHGAYVYNSTATHGNVCVPDLGFDVVHRFRVEYPSGKLTPTGTVTLPPGSGPRHWAAFPRSPRMPLNQPELSFVVNELTGTVSVIEGNKVSGTYSALPEGVTPESLNSTSAAIFVHPRGKFLYASNRGTESSIAVFKINPTSEANGQPTGATLTLVQNMSEGVKTPRAFGLTPTGDYLICANQTDNSLTVYRVDPETGMLTPTGSRIEVGRPICVVMRPLRQ